MDTIPPSPLPPTGPRRLLLAAGVVAVVACGGLILDKLFRGGLPAPFDFTAFWIAGQLLAAGENPYDPARIREMQSALGMDDTAIVAWYPPWGLVPMLPLGFVPFRAAYGVWVLAHLALIIASAELLWRGSGGAPGKRWVAYLLTLTFVPTAFLIGSGQVTTVVLFGLAGFLAARRAGRPYLAGALGALTAIKPHLLALFALWLLVGAARTRDGRKVLLGGLAVGVIGCLLPTLANTHVWADYLHAVTAPSSANHYHLSRWTPPLVGWWLRQEVPGAPFWVQWVPLAVAAAGFAVWYVLSGRRAADPLAAFPWLVGFSLLAAPYGVWQHDLVLVLVPVFAAAVRLCGRPDPAAITTGLAWLMTANAVMLAMMLPPQTSSEYYVWVVPTILIGCRLAATMTARAAAPSTVLEAARCP
jgi:hypothetical protein